MTGKDKERTYTVTQEEYDAEIAIGLTDEEVLRPGTYKVRRNPWAEKLRKQGKVKVRVLRDEEVVEEYWIRFTGGKVERTYEAGLEEEGLRKGQHRQSPTPSKPR